MKLVSLLLSLLLVSSLFSVPHPLRFMHKCMLKWEYSILLPTLTFFLGVVLFPTYILQVFAASVAVAILVMFFYKC